MAEFRRRLAHLLPTRPLVAFLALGPLALVTACSGLPFQDQFKNNSGQPPEQKIELLPKTETGLRPLSSFKAPEPPAKQPAAKQPPAAGLPAIAGLTPLPSPDQVVVAMGSGRRDPFSSPPVAVPVSRVVPLALPENFRFTGVVLSGSQAQAMVQLGELSGSLRQGDRGGRNTDLLPVGWSVAGIDLQRGVLTLSQGQRLLPLQL
jgi:hypothetical protein